MSDEEWRPVVGREGFYEVSDLGRVRSLPRIDRLGRAHAGRVLKGALSGPGRPLYPTRGKYVSVGMSVDGEILQRKVHRLVLEAFMGPCPEGMETRHLNGDSEDNRLINIVWGTPVENGQDRNRHGTQRGLDKTHCNYGHPLSGDNLAPYEEGRACLACSRARSATRSEGRGPTQDERDAAYEEVLRRPGSRGVGQTHCVRMHLLQEPNLTPSSVALGIRRCLACSRATSFVRRRGVPATQELADQYYSQIMTNNPAAAAA